MGRQPAAGQAPDDHLPRRADPFPRGGPHGLRPAYRPAARDLRRIGFQGFYERSDEPRTRRAASRRSAPGGADPAGGDGPRQVGRGEEGRAGGTGQSVRRPRRAASCGAGGSCGRTSGRSRGDAVPDGPDDAPRVHACGNCRAAARGGRRGRQIPRILFRHRDHGFRHLQRPHRRAVARRGTVQSVVRAFPGEGYARVCGDRAAAVRG